MEASNLSGMGARYCFAKSSRHRKGETQKQPRVEDIGKGKQKAGKSPIYRQGETQKQARVLEFTSNRDDEVETLINSVYSICSHHFLLNGES
ncbi:hypothetical protein E2C01_046815 [Portunus trituberculatus]|uniref:Uncharacterized protein n=1 Tax=Portunus trituberculatus TaxID=210409 RepID=A0A5B7G8S8_PORTR|nr:hypothetical protein [Portunus trituberculatus]